MKRLAILVASLCLVAALSFWTGLKVAGAKHSAVTNASVPALVTVEQGTVGQSLRFNAQVKQQTQPVTVNSLTGIVTDVSDAQSFNQGDRLYSVAGTPVVVAKGDKPFYRDLQAGVSGADAGQLITMLQDLGYYSGAQDQTFGAAVETAVKRWQGDLGLEKTGVVPIGQVLAYPSLPAAFTFDRDALREGMELTGGEAVVLAPVGSATMSVTVNEQQSRLIPAGAPVEVTHADRVWHGFIGEVSEDEELHTFTLAIVDKAGKVPCGEQCPSANSGEEMTAKIEIVPSVSGPSVPRAAVMTNATGGTYLVDEHGTQIPVTVKGAADGIAVVDGIELGTVIRVFGESSDDAEN